MMNEAGETSKADQTDNPDELAGLVEELDRSDWSRWAVFLWDRYDEAEQATRKVRRGFNAAEWDWWIPADYQGRDYLKLMNPHRVLVDIAARRELVKLHARCGVLNGVCDDGGHSINWGDAPGCPSLIYMAGPYREHDDYPGDPFD